MHATIYGRAAFDPRQHQTKAGQPMTTCRLAVDVTGRDESDPQTMWIDVLGFGRAAEDLARVEKGAMVSAMGRVTKGSYTAKDGETRETWALLADAVLTARAGRPGARKTSTPSNRANRANMAAQAPLNDDLPAF
jgi:single-strand DNA-binding protein